MAQSVRTIDSPEFINLQPLDLNPLMSSCEIKVLYIGQNRNGTFITKEVATEMSKTLRGAPIVGYFRQEKEDFGDHGDKITLDCDGVHFECLTKPYGFVAPDAQVWFQTFDDTDEFGNITKREYLMTNGYLWTGQFEECRIAVEEGRPQSMEIDSDSMKGHWAQDSKTGMDFFIINDATFSKLCILGEDVEPCFEGAAIAAPSTFSLDKDFKQTLYSMMQDLKKFTLEGGQTAVEIEKQESEVITSPESEFVKKDEDKKEEVKKTEETPAEEKKDEETEKKADEKEEESKPAEDEKDEEDSDKKKPETKSTLIKENYVEKAVYDELSAKYESLQKQCNELRAFKNTVENTKKDELIATFTALTNEEKADVVQNKEKYSYSEIEAKLSILYTHKVMNTKVEREEKPVISTFTVDNSSDNLPAWLRAVRETENHM